MSASARLHRLAPLAAVAVGVWLGAGACGEASGTGERVIFSSNRDGVDGSRHLWMVAPDDPASLVRLTTERAVDDSPSVSPDGELVAFARASLRAPDAYRIWLRSLPDGRETRVTTEPLDAEVADLEPFWAPDGRTLGFSRAVGPGPNGPFVQTLWSVRVDRAPSGIDVGPPIRMAPDTGGNRFHGSWNPATGSDLLFCRLVGGYAPYTIWRLDRLTRREQEVIAHGCCGNYEPAYGPDGSRFAYRSLQQSAHGDIVVANADGTHATRVTCESGWKTPAWSPDGSALVAVRLTPPPGLWRLAVPAAGGPCAEPTPITVGAFQDGDPTWGVVRLR